ncbi:MAG: 3-deoxy-manno-octulosonate cytidylyltransferase [Candidatus Omnitrophota bacterium]|nr:3-deoxy-manno-octulosonate cytidylyltransferase [Candidatus Omnitrophota bacterium]MDZ4241379.1 3-deoxy-manno-octulosonate cytidylyltransferase [Candidatus Omnitrophota bacterium]
MSNQKVIAVIPARMGSSRFPGKPLQKILGLPMVEHVRRRALLCEAVNDVIVATCDREIADTVSGFGGRAVMTKDTHERCTDRVEEAMQSASADVVVILQGDEPLIVPDVIRMLIEPFRHEKGLLCTNLLSVIQEETDLQDQDIVKAALDQRNFVMFYSRAGIPFHRVRKGPCPMYRQTGLSAFTKKFLRQFSQLPPTPLEITESVDFLRILEHRFQVLGVVYDKPTVGVDRPDDVGIVENILQADPEQKRIYEKILGSA